MTLALLWRYRAPLGWTLAVSLAVTLWLTNNATQRERGAMAERVKHLVQDSVSLAHRTAETKRYVDRDTVVITRVATEYDTLYRERVEHLTDTLWVGRTLAKGDTLVRVCRQLVSDCSKLVAQKDTMIDNLNQRLAVAIAAKPSRVGLVAKLAGAAAVGYLVGRHR